MINVQHMGRGGHIEIDGCQYPIELLEGGHFLVYFPAGNKHSKLELHLILLREFTASKEPEWYVDVAG